MTAKDILLKIKAAFADPLPVAPDDTDTKTFVSYAVEGGGSVFVDNTDDGLADIDAGDKVYSDPEMTIPYPDGTFKIAGTDFSFTVVGGSVSTIADPDGTGPGSPIGAPPVTQPDFVAPPVKTVEERLQALEAELSSLKAAALATQAPVMPTGLATEVQLQAASQKIDKHEATIKQMFELVEKLVEEPTADPKTLPANKKEGFAAKKEEHLKIFADSIKKLKENK